MVSAKDSCDDFPQTAHEHHDPFKKPFILKFLE